MSQKQLAEENYYCFKTCVMGAQGVGKSTFCRQVQNGSPKDTHKIESVYYKDFNNIGGKLRVRI